MCVYIHIHTCTYRTYLYLLGSINQQARELFLVDLLHGPFLIYRISRWRLQHRNGGQVLWPAAMEFRVAIGDPF